MERCFALKGDLCSSADLKSLRTVENGYLVCEDAVCMGAFEQLPERYRGIPVIDHTGFLIVPGLVDLHMHAPQHTYCALGMDLELLDWLNQHTYPEEARYADLAYARAQYARLVEALLRGPNTRFSLFATVHTDATAILMDEMEQSGLVSFVGKVNMDRNAPDSLREASCDRSLSDTRAWLDKARSRYANTMPILTPRFIPSCSDPLMMGIAKLQEAFELSLQSHLSENRDEIEWVKALCPDSDGYVDAYIRRGLMKGLPTIMAHCVWNDEWEIEMLKQSATFVAHCPQSNINLASGIAPIRRYLNRGVRVGLGSDVAGGCHSSIFRAMSDAVMVSKLFWRLVDGDEAPLSAVEAFYLGTRGGGAFFGKVGAFEEDYEFDAVVLNDQALNSGCTFTVQERLERAIYLSDDRNVEAKYVRGKRLF